MSSSASSSAAAAPAPPAAPASKRAPAGPPTALDFDLDLGVRTPLPSGKAPCPRCTKKRQWYCPECLVAVDLGPGGADDAPPATLPRLRLPLKLHVLHGREEKNVTSKATGNHAAVLAPDDTAIFTLPDFPAYADPARTLLLFPSPTSRLVHQLPDLAAYDALVVVDTTWGKVGGVMQLPQVTAAPFQHVAIAAYSSLFWRYQPVGPQCLSTIEAAYFFMREWTVEGRRRAALAALGVPRPLGAAPGAVAVAAASSFSSSSSSALAQLPQLPTGLSAEAIAAVPPSDPDNVLYTRDMRASLDPLLLFFLETYARIQAEYVGGKHAGKEFTSKHRGGYIKGGGGGAPAQQSQQQHDEGDGSDTGEGRGDGAGALQQPAAKRSRAGDDSGGDGGDGGASDEGGSGGGSSAPARAQRKPDRIRGAWAIRTDVMDDGARAWSQARAQRFLTSTQPVLRQLVGAPQAQPQQGGSDAAASGGESSSSSAAAAHDPPAAPVTAAPAAAAPPPLPEDVVNAAIFLRVQATQVQEYAVGVKGGGSKAAVAARKAAAAAAAAAAATAAAVPAAADAAPSGGGSASGTQGDSDAPPI